MSSEDIMKGARWLLEIADQLKKAKIGIICLTKENIESPWILFEAGALSNALGKPFVCTYLFGLKPTEIEGPLFQFQHTIANKKETRKLLDTINQALDKKIRLSKSGIDKIFEERWPELENSLNKIPLQETYKLEISVIEILQKMLSNAKRLAR
jgi:hypothetical protein